MFAIPELVKLVDVGTSLDLFSSPTREWFRAAFAQPTEVQERGWREVAAGCNLLPASLLHLRGLGEGGAKPLAGRRREEIE